MRGNESGNGGVPVPSHAPADASVGDRRSFGDDEEGDDGVLVEASAARTGGDRRPAGELEVPSRRFRSLASPP